MKLTMKKQPRAMAGRHLDSGNIAVAEGAIYAGLHGYYGYPITPSTSIMEHIVKRLPHLEEPGYFLQCEDEIASITATIGCSWTRKKAMTATSGPGFSLMQEGIGLAVMTETPLVLVDVMRGGPSTGLPTFPGQQELMQAHFGSHGDYIIPTLAPWSVQECFDLTVEAFNAAEALRTPVFVLSDQVLSTLKEKFVIPKEGELEVVNRAHPGETTTWKGTEISEDLVPGMNCFGEEKKAFSTGLSHDESGHVDLTAKTFERLTNRMFEKVHRYAHLLPHAEKYMMDDAEIVIVTYGSTARSAYEAINLVREQGLKVGMYRLRTIWPFPEEDLRKSTEGREVLVVEMARDQLTWPVERALLRRVHHIAYPMGLIPPPSVITKKVREIGGR